MDRSVDQLRALFEKGLSLCLRLRVRRRLLRRPRRGLSGLTGLSGLERLLGRWMRRLLRWLICRLRLRCRHGLRPLAR